MAGFSVKKPLTVFVAVLAVIVLGVVAYLKMTPDLLPNMDFPYVVIVTTDPGASPEAVEQTVTRPMEQSMATLDKIKTVTSTSQNSVSMVLLEFEDGADMDTISVDIQQKISILEGSWDDMVGAPYVLKINPSMLPVMVAAVSCEDMDVYALSDLVSDELTGKLEGVSGVASVSVSGAVTREAHVILDEKKLEALSGTLADAVKAQLRKAENQLLSAKKQVEEGQAALAAGKKAIADGVVTAPGKAADSAAKKLQDAIEALKKGDIDGIDKVMDEVFKQLEALVKQLEELEKKLRDGKLRAELENSVSNLLVTLMDGLTQLTEADIQLNDAMTQIEDGLKQVREAYKDIDGQTDLGGKLSISTVSQLLTAQNFSMPAGDISDNDGVQYMVSVGDNVTSRQELEDMVLLDLGMEGVEPVTLGDIATVVVTDNGDGLYTKVNGDNGILITFNKQSNYATAEVSNNIKARFAELEAEYEGLDFAPLMDQGDYIYLIVETITSSLLWGALFSVVVLFLFLRDWRPTVITLISIPVSVIFAIVLMYFTGVTINMISLSGLAVAVGMLVDNSVVVIENIYRLRARGATVIQAAVSGAQQVLGAVTASTLTTVCVFAPIVFVEGLTRQMFTDLALTITYSLLASLLVALTLVPAMGAGLLRREMAVKPGLLDKLYPAYRKTITFALDHKAGVLLLSLVLLVTSAWGAVSRGFTFMPEIDMNNLSVTVTMPENTTRDEAVKLADEVLARIMTVDDVQDAGFMMGGGTMASGGGLTMGLSGGSGTASYDINGYITLPEGKFGSETGKEIEALCADLPCEVKASGVMSEMMSYMTGSGVSMQVFGDDMADLQESARMLGRRLEQVDGVAEVDNGLNESAPALQVIVDRRAAAEKGLTVAQVYMQVAAALQSSTTVSDVTLDDHDMELTVDAAEGSGLTREKLLELELTRESSTAAAMGGGDSAALSQLTGEDAEEDDGAFKLGDVAKVQETVSMNTISRDQQRRCVTVSATLSDGYNVTLVTNAAQQAVGSLTLPEGVTVEFNGENEQIMEAMSQLMLMLLLGVVLVYLVMVAQFQSLKSPFIVMFTIPLAFTGGFLALLIAGIEVSVISLIGFVMLVGIIVNNGIVLVDYINQQRLAGMERREAIIDACVTRLRPILMTSLTTILGLVVTAAAKNAGTALIQPIAVVCIGGLLYATLMTLFVVPCMYEIMNKKELRHVDEKELEIVDM